MQQVKEKAPFKIPTVLTDNGKSFTDRFTRAGECKPSGNHEFDQECQADGIEHRLIKPGGPQTNGMVERFNGRISDVLATRRLRLGRGPGADAQTLHLAIQSSHSTASAAPPITDCGDEGMAVQTP
jgi:transposase InsO family protein